MYVLYGSQTGNSESLAKDLSSKLSEDGIPTACHNLNEMKNFPFKEKAICLVIICSTTGNADCPENADVWWRSVKLRSLVWLSHFYPTGVLSLFLLSILQPKDLFQDVKFAVLGLGDTNYDKFCHMGKSIDKRLEELGGIRYLDLRCADEATGLEETVEEWKVAIEDKVKQIVSEHQS